jgi:RNA polymerase sigma factor (sigma-70 family)
MDGKDSPGEEAQNTEWVTTTTVLERLRSDDPAAWQRFVVRFRAPVSRFAASMGLGSEAADDATQDTLDAFLAAFRDGRYDPAQGRLSAWLFGFARKVVLGARRDRGRDRGRAAQDTGFWQRVPDEQDPEEVWNDLWEKSVMEACLERLEQEIGATAFRVFSALAMENRSGAEVAKEMGMSRNAALVAKHRALKRLQRLRAEYEGQG